MLTVGDVADRYGVTVRFVAAALGQLGYRAAGSDSPLSAAIVARFEKKWGEAIRARRPKTELGPATTVNHAQPKPKPHVMRVAHHRVTAGRDAAGNRAKQLLPNPGPVHAIDLVGTRDGDGWRGEVVGGAVHFFGGPINSGPSAACGRAHMRAVLSDEFVPADDPEAEGQCPRCAAIVADGNGFRDPPQDYYYDPFCHEYLRVKIDGHVEVQDCFLRDPHRGPHRTKDGATWDVGFDDYVPAPLDASRRISTAS